MIKVANNLQRMLEKQAWGDSQFEEDVFLDGFNFADKKEAIAAINKLQELATKKDVDLSFRGQTAPYPPMTAQEAIKAINEAKLNNFKYENTENMVGGDGGYLEANLPWFYRFTSKNTNTPIESGAQPAFDYSSISSLLSKK